ncbi:unnamed protein product [Rhizoctonia solani]|uniref:BTB domain-containing protein n=1 Tax=Rhizoctonia solani TaxID=456999 RepID=A0A8H2WTL1_9AGAM|nr:unnamed protein product [Rhizoctonia solani]
MSKRPSETIISSQPLSQSAPFKRAKKEKTPELEVTFVDDGLSSIPDTSSEAEEELASPVRDPEFYYEDGSITFRVGDVLFKVHASLLKLESRDFEKTFDVPPKFAEATRARGSCDENPIIIPDAKASHFRVLMEIIYRPHYLDHSTHNASIWQQFMFYLSAVRLANRFSMNRIEKWARPEIAELFHESGKKISLEAHQVSKANESESKSQPDDGDAAPTGNRDSEKVNSGSEKKSERGESESRIAGGTNGGTSNTTSDPSNSSSQNLNPNSNGTSNTAQLYPPNDTNKANTIYGRHKSSSSSSSASEDDTDKEDERDNDEEMEDGESQYEIALPPEDEEDPEFQLMDALLYAESVSDSSLQCDVRNVLQYHCVHPEYLPVGTLANLFKEPDLKEKDPSMFGFLFVILLDQGNQVWKQDIFTRMDRMAFFSAQSYLTPFPDSLKTLVVVPLFTKLISPKSFATIFSDGSTKKSCAEECYTKAFTCWQEEFDEGYYADISNKSTLAPLKALITIPRRRLNLAEKLIVSECEQECHLKLLSQVDRDVQGLYARLAEYYQGIE